MSNEPSMGQKICVICRQDCSNRPRTKDAKGRYYCRECYDQAHSARPKLPARQHGMAPTKRPADAAAMDDGLSELDLAAIESDSTIVESGPSSCPGCGAPLGESVVLCTMCGYSRAVGRKIGAPMQASQMTERLSGSAAMVEKLAQPAILSIGGSVIFLAAFLFGLADASAAKMAIGIISIGNIVAGLALIGSAFGAGVGTALMTLCVPFYSLYFAFSVCENRWIKHGFAASLFGSVLTVVLYLKFPELLKSDTGGLGEP